jgi:hypothetical protein
MIWMICFRICRILKYFSLGSADFFVYNFGMTTIQLPLDEKLLKEVEKIRQPLGKNLPDIIHEALQSWVKHNEIQIFEQQWTKALKKNPDVSKRAEDWLPAQVWKVIPPKLT